MLPRADGLGITDAYLVTLIEGPHGIRNDPILGPVSSSDDIAGTCTGYTNR